MRPIINQLRKFSNSPTVLSQVGGLVNMGSALLVLPLMVSLLPASEIALWLYYSLFVGLGMMADFGFGPSLLRSTSYFISGAKTIPLGNEKIEKISAGPNLGGLESLLSTYLVCYRWILIISVILAAVLGMFFSGGVINASADPRQSIISGILILAAMAVGLRAAVWSNYIQGLGFVADCKRMELILGLARILFYTAALLLGGGVLGMAIASVIISCITYCWQKHVAVARHRQFGCSWPLQVGYDKELFQRTWPATWRQGAIGIGGYLITQSGGLVSGALKDSSLMASYLFTLRLLGIARNLALAPVQVAVPRFIQLRTCGDISGLKKELVYRTILCLVIASSLCAAFWLAIGYYVEWAGKDLRLLSWPMYLVASITALLEVNHCAFSVFYITKNKVPFLWASIISGIAIISLGLLVVNVWSIWGLLSVQAVVQLAFNNWYPIYLVVCDFKSTKKM
jgi:hypothetical protein